MEMYDFYSANYNHHLKDLKGEEARLEKFLKENSDSLSSIEISRIQNTLLGIRSEEKEITQMLSSNQYM